uniref:AB hydrolase-1 domain-containing protein n=1 Tax=Panagrolaimus sp. JU765 TaxID=591449 RepID=A0AC34Q4M4_9BILA
MVKAEKPGFLEKITSLLMLVFFTTLYSTLALIRLAFMWFQKGHALFEIKPHLKPKTLDGWMHGFLDLTEIKMHYVETGDASKPLMLFVHGFPEFWYSYRHQLKYFERNYHCVAVDLRGYGDSSRPTSVASYGVKTLVHDLIEAIEKLGRKKAIVVAHDWGALLAWNLALTRPEMVEKLVILNVPHPLAFRKQFKTGFKQLFKSWYMFLFQAPFLPELLLSLEDFKMLISMFKGKKSGLVHSENFTDDDVEAWKYTFSKLDAFKGPINYYRALLRQIDAPKHEDWTVKPKTLIIWGDQDAALAVEGAIDSVNFCENGVLKRIPDASHWVQQDVPDVVNSLIDEFLNENDLPKSNI